MKVLIAGASGLIGTALQQVLRDEGHQVHTLVRRAPRNVTEHGWRPDEGQIPAEAVEWADGVVSLSGAPLGRLPWTSGYRRTLYRSRVDPTRTLATAIAAAEEPPAVWVSGSAVGYYGDRPGEVLTESSEAGSGFLAGLVLRWEAAASVARMATRVVHARTGIALAPGGALQPLFLATRFGAGSRMGSGRQHWPWVSLTDEARAIAHLLTGSTLAGAVNITSPRPASADEITGEVAEAMSRPHLLRLPAPLLRAVMGEAAEELLLADQQVRPQRLLDDGFEFHRPELTEAVRTALAA